MVSETKPMQDEAIAAFLAEVGSVDPERRPSFVVAAVSTPRHEGHFTDGFAAPTAAELEDLVDPAAIAAPAPGPAELFTAEELLDGLAELEAQAAALRLTLEAALDSIVTSEQRAAMAAARQAYGPRIEEAQALANEQRAAIVDLVKARGATVKGARLQAVYAKGRVSWDAKALDGYAKAHPELLEFRAQGDPSVSIRAVK